MGMIGDARAGVGVSGVGKFIGSKVLKLWYFAKSDHKNVKLASLKQCHFYAQHKISEPKYFHEPLQASPSRIHPPRLQHTPQTHSPTLENTCWLAAPLHKHLHSFHTCFSLSDLFSVADKGEPEGEQRPSQLWASSPSDIFYLPNSGTPGSTRSCNCERVPPRMVFIFAKYKKFY